MSARGWSAALALAVVAGAVVALGVANPVPAARIGTDRLGPETGEPVDAYLARAAATLDGPAADASDGQRPETEHGSLTEHQSLSEHWALLSLIAPVTSEQLVEIAGDVRVSQVLFQVPLDRVQTPIVTVPVAANAAAVSRSPIVASARLQQSVVGHDRQSLISAHSAAQLSGGCACVVAATVRGELAQLRELVGDPRVRAVEALPSDAVAGSFAVSPLLPVQTVAAVPGPDDGAVPGLDD